MDLELKPFLFFPGIIQSFAGFTDYFTAMAQEGWFPLMCVGLRSQWEDVHLQDLQDSYGQEWVGRVNRRVTLFQPKVLCDA